MNNFSITIIDENNVLTFEEICRAIHVDHDLMIQLIEYHIVQPKGSSKNNWAFDHISLKRAKLARNFYYDLEINVAGIGLLLDMLERIDALEAHVEQLKI